jgi:CYTH domain-containing protein
MPQRRFIIASAPARLIRKDNGVVGRVVEGYFPARPDREHFVSIEPGRCYLVLAAAWQDGGDEERTEVPRSQAEALMPLCVGKVGFECTTMRLRGRLEALLKHFVAPGPLDLLSVEFEAEADAEAFVPPAWFGPEVTQDAAYDGGSFARLGIPASDEIPLSNAMLEELLDTLEESVTAAQLGHVFPRRAANAGPTGGQTDAADREPDPPPPPVESAQDRKPSAGFAPAREGPPALPSSSHPRSAAETPPEAEGRRGDRLIFGLPTRRARQ